MERILRYGHPAGEFKNGLPIGNGRLAAMVCGDEKHIRLALNHEWLWRGNVDDLNTKADDIRRIYEAEDIQTAEDLLEAYGIEYLFVGSCEREKYEIRDAVLQNVGEVMYEENGTYIVRLGEQ